MLPEEIRQISLPKLRSKHRLGAKKETKWNLTLGNIAVDLDGGRRREEYAYTPMLLLELKGRTRRGRMGLARLTWRMEEPPERRLKKASRAMAHCRLGGESAVAEFVGASPCRKDSCMVR